MKPLVPSKQPIKIAFISWLAMKIRLSTLKKLQNGAIWGDVIVEITRTVTTLFFYNENLVSSLEDVLD